MHSYPPAPADLNWREHYELSTALFYAIVETLAEGRPLPTIRATPDPKPEAATKRKHRKASQCDNASITALVDTIEAS